MASNALTRLSQRTPLRVKLITALLALVALALAIISFTSVAFFRAYLVNQTDGQLQTLVSQATNGAENGLLTPQHSVILTVNGYFVEVRDQQGNIVPEIGNPSSMGSNVPIIPTSESWLAAHSKNPVTVPGTGGGHLAGDRREDQLHVREQRHSAAAGHAGRGREHGQY